MCSEVSCNAKRISPDHLLDHLRQGHAHCRFHQLVLLFIDDLFKGKTFFQSMHPLLTHSSKEKKQRAKVDELKSYQYPVNYHKDIVPPVGSLHRQLSFFW